MKKGLILFLVLLSLGLKAQDKGKAPTVSVKGTSNLKVQPDEGMLNLSATFIGMDVNQAMLGLDKKTKELIKRVVAAGLNEKDIKTINFQLNKHTVYHRDYSKDSGYIAMQSLQVKFNYSKEKVAKIVTTFSESKADYTMHFNFMLSDTLKKHTENKLMKLAVNDARNKAAILSMEAGVKLKSIKHIEYGHVAETPFYPMAKTRSMMADGAGDAGMQGFTPDDIELTDEVLITWELE